MKNANDTSPSEPTGDPITRQIRRVLMVLLVIITVVVVGFFLDGRINGRGPLAQVQSTSNQTPSETANTALPASETASQTAISPSLTPTISPPEISDTPVPGATSITSQSGASIASATDLIPNSGTLFLSIDEGGYKHLFAYHPQNLPFTRMTSGTWDDIDPSISPDGSRLAFASSREGFWDIYILDISTGKTTRFTDTPEFDGAPAWSPDGQWLVYESYTDTLSTLPTQGATLSEATTTQITATPPVTVTVPNLEILIRPADGSQPAIRLTNDPAADYAPVWSPAGRQIAYVSNRTGENEVWLADLDRIDDRFHNISNNPKANDAYPAWSPDGTRLSWTRVIDSYQNIVSLDINQPGAEPHLLGGGNRPAWSPDGDIVLTTLPTPNRTYLTAYRADASGLALPPLPLPGQPAGLTWGRVSLPQPLPSFLSQAARITTTPAANAQLTPATNIPAGRQRVVELEDVQAPYAKLHDSVDESFNALRLEVASRLGWDFLATLENAYVPLTSPLFPGLLNDWLYTGRAIVINQAPINAGWMVIMRDDFGPTTYWRVYLRTRFQDGSQGMPLHDIPWDLNARYAGDPRDYEQGGSLAPAIPPGYWLDFTNLAASYGWERLPALSTWRSALPAARYNEFVHTDDLDWFSAMVEIYPVEAVYTPTPIQPPTFTPTPTRRPTRTPTPTRTPFPSRTPTITRTPMPLQQTISPTP